MNNLSPRFDRVRVTKVGLAYILLTLVVGLAAANTGNNALYMVEAMLLALLAVSGIVSRRNLMGLGPELEAPAEVYAGRPFTLGCRLRNRERRLAKRLLELSTGGGAEARLVPYLGPGGERDERFALTLARRGRHRVDFLRVTSIFPLGLFRKTMRYATGLDLLVFPPIHPVTDVRLLEAIWSGERPSRVAGRGHELHALRDFRDGDDPRGIHWKQSARTGRAIFMVKEREQGRRVSIVLDNGVGAPATAADRERFETLVSQAASAVVHYLDRGYSVQLVTRDGHLPFGRGRRQRLRLLEALALIEPVAAAREPLQGPDPTAPELRLELPARAERLAS